MQTGLYHGVAPNTATDAAVLVTGATGLIGRWLVPELTRQGFVVAAAMRGAAERADDYRRWVAARSGDPTLVRCVEHDLDHDEELAWSLPQVRYVVHLAARFAWHLPLAEARRANVDGALRLVRWASRQPALARFVLVSGYRVSVPSDGRGSGAYERSKREAHEAVLAEAARLAVPTTVVNPSSVIGDSATGCTTQLLGPGELMSQLASGALPVAPGDARTFVPLIPVDVVARFIVATMDDPESLGRQYLLLDETTPTLRELLRSAALQLGATPPRLHLPVGLIRWLPERLLGAPRETLEFISPDRYDVRETRAAAARLGVAWPPIHEVWPRWLDYLASTGFAPERGPELVPERTA